MFAFGDVAADSLYTPMSFLPLIDLPKKRRIHLATQNFYTLRPMFLANGYCCVSILQSNALSSLRATIGTERERGPRRRQPKH